ncbi:hypothetical protein CC85DRAFT_300623 [Cutaneotrichosporon oleaginosum]|uniref:Uncharacterized protein n=1 Tax=Cutaneotrichosporon oleaginosum TaxID=879819 RepID=A0A0J0XSX7_9TREE|nr:uncharacterized protein CC85DRAFT_300623 [Cutaneotrichosporon oleaginosum]KLT44186.1 hypothetical protein CC85DRAFT_300623 [Cutaneotrichosporon oleaginosum]TXT11645.1 hypothetical protein COLE_02055 [Cutaneotrichosporon oleaginosum]
MKSPLLTPLRSLSHTPAPPTPADIEEGFDLSPPLTTPNDLERYSAFLHHLRKEYKDDPGVREDPDYEGIGGIVFDVRGEHPWIPYDGRRFRRFSATLHSPTSTPGVRGAGGADDYLARVEGIARHYFGHRVHSWSEACETAGWRKHGVYNWMEVRHAVLHVFKEDEERSKHDNKAPEMAVDAPKAAQPRVVVRPA